MPEFYIHEKFGFRINVATVGTNDFRKHDTNAIISTP